MQSDKAPHHSAVGVVWAVPMFKEILDQLYNRNHLAGSRHVAGIYGSFGFGRKENEKVKSDRIDTSLCLRL